MGNFNINDNPQGLGAIPWLVNGLKTLWRRVNGISSSGGGSTGITIGQPITGGTPNLVLYEDGIGNLHQASNFAFDGANLILVTPSPGDNSTKAATTAYVDTKLPAIVAQAHLLAQSTAFAVLDYAPTVASGCYKIEYSMFVNTSRISSITLAYTDENGVSVSLLIPVVKAAAITTLTTVGNSDTGARVFAFPFIFTATNATHITLTTGISGTPSYDIDVVLTRLN